LHLQDLEPTICWPRRCNRPPASSPGMPSPLRSQLYHFRQRISEETFGGLALCEFLDLLLRETLYGSSFPVTSKNISPTLPSTWCWGISWQCEYSRSQRHWIAPLGRRFVYLWSRTSELRGCLPLLRHKRFASLGWTTLEESFILVCQRLPLYDDGERYMARSRFYPLRISDDHESLS